MSFGQAWLSGEVLTPEPVELDLSEEAHIWIGAVEQATGLASLQDRFQRHIFIGGPDLFSNRGIAGTGTLGCSSNANTVATGVWLLTAGRHALVHEFGHNLGLGHAQSIRNGKLVDYGDRSSLMALGRGYFSAMHLFGIGWINEDNIVTVDEYDLGRGSYALKLLHADGGHPPGSSPVALRIRRKPRIEDDEQWLPRRITEGISPLAEEPITLDSPIDLENEEQWLWVEGQSRFASLPPEPGRDTAHVRIEGPSLNRGGTATYAVSPFRLEAAGDSRQDLPVGQMPAERTWEDPNSPLSLRVEFTSDGLTVHVGWSDAFPLISSNGIALATGTPVVRRISPNALVSVFGRYFAPEGTRALTPELNAAGGVADNLAGICLEIAGERVPLFAVFPHQINAQAPRGLTQRTARFDVVRGCGTPGERRGHTEPVDVAPVSPAFFNFVSNPDGRNPVVALHGSGPALVGPPGAATGAALTPAAPGEIVTLFGTGFGPTEPALEAGRIPGVQARLAGQVSFYFGSVEPPAIETVAGNGTPGFSGDGGAATATQLNGPSGVAVDGAGNLYIADASNRRIRKVDAAGVITRVAGNGTPGFSGDGGPAVAAQLSFPSGVAVDGAGNLYIADSVSNSIRKVDAAGVITTVAGDGTRGYGGDGGAATAAQLKLPSGVAVDGAGNLYIADASNRRIRKVDAAGVITTVAGDGVLGNSGDGGPASAARLYGPTGVALDGAGNLYIADWGNDSIRKVDYSTGVITTVAGTGINGYSGDGGLPTEAQLNRPQHVALDGAGNLYIADRFNNRIRRVSVQFKGSSHAVPLYAGTAPCCAGLYQFTVRLPDDLPDGNVAVTAVVQGVPTPTGPFLAIQRR